MTSDQVGPVVGAAIVFVAVTIGVLIFASHTPEPKEIVVRVCRPSPERPCSCLDAELRILDNGDVACVEVRR